MCSPCYLAKKIGDLEYVKNKYERSYLDWQIFKQVKWLRNIIAMEWDGV